MTDVGLFAFGCVVSIVAVTGFGLILYGRYFRPAWVRDNLPTGATAPDPSGRATPPPLGADAGPGKI